MRGIREEMEIAQLFPKVQCTRCLKCFSHEGGCCVGLDWPTGKVSRHYEAFPEAGAFLCDSLDLNSWTSGSSHILTGPHLTLVLRAGSTALEVRPAHEDCSPHLLRHLYPPWLLFSLAFLGGVVHRAWRISVLRCFQNLFSGFPQSGVFRVLGTSP